MAYPRELDGADLLGWAQAAVALLNARRADINALNVFPVPDSDTGSNMAHTMSSALEQANKLDQQAKESAEAVAQALAAGSVRGARGNSGVVLSQVLRGVAHAASRGTVDGRAIVDALTTARAMVEKAIADPVEGTVITVLRAAADAATAAQPDDLHHVLTAAVDAATTALANTTHQLPALRDAGVVDAGGQGLVLLLQALLNLVAGSAADSFHMTAPAAAPTGTTPTAYARPQHCPDTSDAAAAPGDDKAPHATEGTRRAGGDTQPEELEIMAYLSNADLDEVARSLENLGDCLVIARASDTEGTIHLHSPARRAGTAIDVLYQHASVSDLRLEILPPHPTDAPSPRRGVDGSVVIALVPAGPLADLFAGEGAKTIDPAAQPAEQLSARIIDSLDPEDNSRALLLSNGVASNEQLHDALNHPRISSLGTNTLAAGLAALAVYDPNSTLDEARASMEETISAMRTCTIAPVDSPCLTPVGAANRGDFAATTAGGDIIAVDADILACTAAASTNLLGDGGELLTLLVADEHAHAITPDTLARQLRTTQPTTTHGSAHSTPTDIDIDITVYPLGDVDHAIEIGVE